MPEKNKTILEKGNASIAKGDNEGFLAFCSDDTRWTFVGDKVLHGKHEVRRWMTATYIEPPKFIVKNLIAEGDYVTALGDITMKDEAGRDTLYTYCDVWRFRDGKIVELTAFVIRSAVQPGY
ncbi:MAG TPA: nuclear transport factor 2 family protein [Ohtaekwangia sp.]|nr:nuclear transport factor 2 family protein [Ohtaekwangia sp.]